MKRTVIDQFLASEPPQKWTGTIPRLKELVPFLTDKSIEVEVLPLDSSWAIYGVGDSSAEGNQEEYGKKLHRQNWQAC